MKNKLRLLIIEIEAEIVVVLKGIFSSFKGDLKRMKWFKTENEIKKLHLAKTGI